MKMLWIWSESSSYPLKKAEITGKVFEIILCYCCSVAHGNHVKRQYIRKLYILSTKYFRLGLKTLVWVYTREFCVRIFQGSSYLTVLRVLLCSTRSEGQYSFLTVKWVLQHFFNLIYGNIENQAIIWTDIDHGRLLIPILAQSRVSHKVKQGYSGLETAQTL